MTLGQMAPWRRVEDLETVHTLRRLESHSALVDVRRVDLVLWLLVPFWSTFVDYRREAGR
jgi:hypothetical protein